jgi:hypothetical protein
MAVFWAMTRVDCACCRTQPMSAGSCSPLTKLRKRGGSPLVGRAGREILVPRRKVIVNATITIKPGRKRIYEYQLNHSEPYCARICWGKNREVGLAMCFFTPYQIFLVTRNIAPHAKPDADKARRR